MQFLSIDKQRYQQHLNRIIIVAIASLAGISLAVSQSLIALFGQPDQSHFAFNLFGVVVACVVIATVLSRLQHQPYFFEVRYVYRLKQQLNLINRKLRKLQSAALQGDVDAFICLNYLYQGSRQLWQLDDNSIVLEDLSVWQSSLAAQMANFNITVTTEQYQPALLAKF